MSKMWLHPRYGNSGRQRVRSCQFYIRLLHSASYCRIEWKEEEGVGVTSPGWAVGVRCGRVYNLSTSGMTTEVTFYVQF